MKRNWYQAKWYSKLFHIHWHKFYCWGAPGIMICKCRCGHFKDIRADE